MAVCNSDPTPIVEFFTQVCIGIRMATNNFLYQYLITSWAPASSVCFHLKIVSNSSLLLVFIRYTHTYK